MKQVGREAGLEEAPTKAPTKAPRDATDGGEEYYRFLANSVPDQVWTAKPDGALEYVNDRVTTYFGRTFDEMIGAGWQDVVHPDDLPGVVSSWVHALGSGEPYEVEFRLRRAADGQYLSHVGRALPLRDAEGRIVKWFGTNTDISERKRSESERERLISALERSNRELDQAVRSRDDLLATVSHDLRSPVSTVLMASVLLRRDPTAGEGTQLVRTANAIARAAQYMDRLIKDLLDLAAIEAGQLSVSLEAHPVGPLISSALERAQTAASSKSVDLVARSAAPEAWVRCDSDRIAQVFANLLGNAIKFTPTGGTITLAARVDGDQVHFTLSDTGAGIPAADLPHIFDRFWKSKERPEAGSGLGLAICRGILSQHGAQIHVESTPEQGTTFSFHLPTCPPRPVDEARPAPRVF